MFGRDKVSYGILSLTLFMFLLALMVNATPVTNLDGVAHQPTMTVLEPEIRRMSVAGIPHDPIVIDGDADFAATALAEGWLGDGSSGNPYIIDSLDIDLGSGVGDCISISNTRVYFIISNCYLTGATVDFGSGIYLENVNYAILDHNTCTGNINGIHLESSYYNTVANNTCTSNARFAIVLYRSNENILANNTCTDNTDGISFNHGILNTAANNTCTSNTYGIFFNNAGQNKAVNNTFNDNEYGLTLHISSSNNINWNVFADNTINARDAPSNTFEYNFWSDYTGIDADGDGIGDTAYTMGYTSDPYPLMFLPTGPVWIETPVNQNIEIGTHFTYGLNAMAYSPLFWSVNDTVHFTIDSQGVLESIGLLSLGNHGVRVTVSNIYGVSLSASFIVEVLFVIDGDASFAGAAQVEGWPGDGSAGNPYVIDGLDIDLSGESGHCISISNTRVYFTISNCHMIGASEGAGIHLENVMYGKLLENIFDSDYYGIYLYYSDQNTVANNTCTSSTYGIYLYQSDSNTVANNTCTSNNEVGIVIRYCFSNTVSNNTCTSNFNYGIWLYSTYRTTVANNTCTSNSRGIHIWNSDSNIVTNNTCTSNTRDGISFYISNSNIVTNNTCISNDWGIFLHNSGSNTVSNNTCTSNTDYGIYLGASDFNTVSNNTCTSNFNYGIWLYHSDSTTVANNTCTSNSYGIYLDNAVVNNIYWNVFIDNSLNAVDNLGDNTFDYNFWSDYTGTDANGDGIGDTPYTFTGNSDPHPLMFLPTPPIWTQMPVDQTIKIGTHFIYELDATAPAPILWSVNDTTHFTIDSQGVLESIGNLPHGDYGVRLTVSNIYGVGISATFTVKVLFLIDGDASFALAAQTEGWLGDGSVGNPYVIDGLDIDLGGEIGDCISISNTRVYFIISNCHLTGASEGAGIYLENVMHGKLLENIFDSDYYGIHLYYSDQNTVANNTCTRNSYGIRLYGSDYNTVANNTCTSNIYGVCLSSSDSNTVTDNTCASDSGAGIYLTGSDSNTVTNNTCTNNRIGIIILHSSVLNTLTKNTCTSNTDYGIVIDGGADSNDIHWNIFADNSLNGRNTGSNSFDYNFWSDYAGTDANNDGFGDTPYSGSGFSDPCPLMYLPTPPRWIEPPVDQTVEFEHLFHYELNILCFGPLVCSVSDTAHFNIDNRGVVESTGILPISSYDLRVNVANIYGFSITAIFRVRVVVDARNPPGWMMIPTDQSLAYGEKFEYQLTAIDPSGIDYWELSDMTHFTLSVSLFDGGSTARITNSSALELESYELTITVYDVYGNGLSADFTVTVEMPEMDASPPVWLVAPADQDLQYGETFDYSLAAADPSGVALWIVDDTDLFVVDWESRLDYSIGRIRSIGVLNPGIYVLNVEAHDTQGNVLTGTFSIAVVQRLELTLSGSFDFLLKEEINLQISALLTDLDTRESVSGATVTFDIYDPDGVILVSGTMVEDPANPGVYIYVTPDTMKDLKLPKGIYLVYAHATLADGAEAVDMIQFHIDPPGASGPDSLFLFTAAGFVGMVLLDSVLVGRYLLRRRRRIDSA